MHTVKFILREFITPMIAIVGIVYGLALVLP